MKAIKNNIKENLVYTSIILSLPIILIFLIGPLEIYIGNINEFNYGVETVFIPFFCIFFGFICFGTLFLSVIPKKINRIICYLIFFFTFISYLQNLFFNKYLFSRDGSRINWSNISSYTQKINLLWIISIIIFITILLISISKKKEEKLFYLSKSITLFLLIIQIITIVSMLGTGIKNHKVVSHKILSGNEQYTYGSKDNIIVLVLDRYTNTEFEDLLNEYPEFSDSLKDFTYYDNTDSSYAYTFPSLAHVLTGENPDISMSRSEWFNYVWNSEKCNDLYDLLHNSGYKCRLYSSEEAYIVFGNLDNLDDKFDNIVNSKPRKNYGMMLKLYTKMSLYKYSPYCLKPYFEISSSDAFKDIVVYDNQDGTVDYYNYEVNESLNLKQVSVSEKDDKMYTFMHVSGLHERNNDKDGNYVEEYSVSIEDTKIGLAKIVTKYIEILKEEGIYDNSTIIIMGDHGKNPSNGIDPQPIFIIKKSGEKHVNMEVNSAPISFDDFQATILSCANIDYDENEYGTSIFDWKEKDNRERTLSLLEDGFMQYTYTGDRYDLMDMIKSNKGIHTKYTQEW